MADLTHIKGKIQETIYPNGQGAITAEAHQRLLLDMVDEINEKKADSFATEGYYPKMTVGFAENLVGRGESIPSEFTFRASGGKSIKDGAAQIKRIKGNTTVVDGKTVNMRVTTIRSVGDNAWGGRWYQGGVADSTGQPNPYAGTNLYSDTFEVIGGESYYAAYESTVYFLKGFFFNAEGEFLGSSNFDIDPRQADKSFTAPAGAAYARMRFWNSGGQIVIPSDAPQLMVSLKHSGWKQDVDAAYQPYWEDYLNIDIVTKYFPDGMRSVGEVYDEISYNRYEETWEAIQRIGEDGKALLEPIVMPIAENFNPTYRVADFGTEKAYSAQTSAPFRADIIYEFNAVDMIRELWQKVQDLEARL